MDCNSFRQYIDDYIDNDISNVVKHEMMTHMNSCAECKKELEDVKKMVEYINSMPKISVPDDFMTNLTRRINAEDIRKITNREDRYKRIFNYRTYSAVAACILLFVMFKADIPGMLSHTKSQDSSQQSINSVLSEDSAEKEILYDTAADTAVNTDVVTETTITPVETTAPDITAQVEVAVAEPIVTPIPTTKDLKATTAPKAVTPSNKNTQITAKATTKKADTTVVTPTQSASTQTATAAADNAAAQSESIAAYSVDAEQPTTAAINTTDSVHSAKASAGGGSSGGASASSGSTSATTSGTSAKNTAYTITVNHFNKQAAITALSEAGASNSGSYYTISASKLGTLWSKLSEKGISYVKTATEIGDSDTAILYVYFK